MQKSESAVDKGVADMLIKRAVFDGPKEKGMAIVSALQGAGIKAYLDYPNAGHPADVARSAGVGRYGESSDPKFSQVTVYVKRKDIDAAQDLIRSLK